MTRRVSLMAIVLSVWLCAALPGVARAASATGSTAVSGTVLVTGSSRGIGLELVRQYAAAGWTVIATARKPAESASLRELAARHSNVRLEALDVVDGASVAALRDRLRGVSIDVLINNAGDTDQFRGQSLGTLDHDRFDYLMRLNAQGPLRVTEALLPNLETGTQKKIVALSPGQVDTQGYAARGIVVPGTVPVEQSVAGLRNVVEGLTPAQSGSFIRYSGEVQPW